MMAKEIVSLEGTWMKYKRSIKKVFLYYKIKCCIDVMEFFIPPPIFLNNI